VLPPSPARALSAQNRNLFTHPRPA